MKKWYFALAFLYACNLNAQTTSGQCCDFAVSQQPDPGGATFGVALGDIDADGDLDAAVVHAYEGLQIYLNDGEGNYTFQTVFSAGDDFFGVYLLDIDFDGDLDLIASAFYNSQNTKVYKNSGTGQFSLFQTIQTNIAIRELAIGDIDNDGDPDLFIPTSTGSNGQVWKNNGVGFFVKTQTLDDCKGEDAALGDLDGDGDLDAFVVRNSSGAGNTVWLNDGSGNFTNTGQSLGLNSSQSVALGDLDGDGDLDAIEANWGTQQVWLNDGAGFFSEGFLLNNNNYAKSVQLADNDLDGDLDIFLGYYGDGTQVWTNDGNGVFQLCFESQNMYAHDITLGDINNDGLIDIYAGYFSNTDGDFVLINRSTVAFITTDGPTAFCEGDSLTLAANAGAGYSWNTGAGTQSITVTEPGEYWVVVSDTAFCAAQSAPLTVAVYELPEVSYEEVNDMVFTNTPAFELSPGTPPGGTYSGPGVSGAIFDPAAAGAGSHLVEYAFTDANGCSAADTSLIVVEVNASAGEAGTHPAIRVFPNPAGEWLTIEAGQNAPYAIYDAQGRIVRSGRLEGKTARVDLSTLPEGLYFWKLKTESGPAGGIFLHHTHQGE